MDDAARGRIDRVTQPPNPPYQQQPGPYGGPPSPYRPPNSGGVGKIVAIVVAVVVGVLLLLCAGIVAVVFLFVDAVDDVFDDFDPDRRGGRDNPITVAEGEAFTIDEMDYHEGWAVRRRDTAAGSTIAGLRVTNDRDREDSHFVAVDFEFFAGNRSVGEIDCSSTASVAFGDTVTLECVGLTAIPARYDRIEVSAD